MTSYMSVSEFRLRTIMPQSDVDQLEISDPGFLAQTLDDWSDEINARLSKRYDVPFAAPIPPTVLRWLNKLTTREAYAKRGYNPSAKSDQESIEAAALRAETELAEAANSQTGLFELPTKPLSRGGPSAYSEASPYKWYEEQLETAYGEDSS